MIFQIKTEVLFKTLDKQVSVTKYLRGGILHFLESQ